jgi:hypothetical protein
MSRQSSRWSVIIFLLWTLTTVVVVVEPYHTQRHVVFGTNAAAAFFIPSRQRLPRKYSLSSVQRLRLHFGSTQHARRGPNDTAVVTSLSSGTDANQDVSTTTTSKESSLSTSDSTILMNNSLQINQTTKTIKKKTKGVYVRPSAAIERGSGFFVPGLEGYKVRLLVGSMIVVLTILLHSYNSYSTSVSSASLYVDGDNPGSGGNLFAESLALFYGLLVLIQGSIEARKNALPFSNQNESSISSSKVQVYQQQWSVELSDIEWRNKVEWVASTYLSLTTATNMILIGPGKIIFSLGSIARLSDTISGDEESEGCNAALATLAQSTSGRLSLPMNHVAVRTILLPFASSSIENDTIGIDSNTVTSVIRSVVLQRINDQLCWMMVSNQLLASFTTNDLQWLGQLAKYTNPE